MTFLTNLAQFSFPFEIAGERIFTIQIHEIDRMVKFQHKLAQYGEETSFRKTTNCQVHV